MVLDSGARERGAVASAGRNHLDAAVGKGEQERNSKVMVLTPDAEQGQVQGVVLPAAFAQSAPIRGMWQTSASPAVRSPHRTPYPGQSTQHGIFKPTTGLRNIERRRCQSASDVAAARRNVSNIGFENLAALRGTQNGLRTGIVPADERSVPRRMASEFPMIAARIRDGLLP